MKLESVKVGGASRLKIHDVLAIKMLPVCENSQLCPCFFVPVSEERKIYAHVFVYLNLSVFRCIRAELYPHIHTVSVYIYITTHPHTYTPTHLHTYTPTHLHTYTPTHLHTYTPTQLHTYTPTHLHNYTPTHTYTTTHTHTYIYI